MSDGYEALKAVLTRAAADCGGEVAEVLGAAYEQSSRGKGRERHAEGKSWLDQPIFTIPDLVNSDGFTIGQAMKKLHEQQGMDWERGRAECLGAIVYLSAAAVRLERDMQPAPSRDPGRLIPEVGRLQNLIEQLTATCAPGQSQSAKRASLVDVVGQIGQYVADRDGEVSDSDDDTRQLGAAQEGFDGSGGPVSDDDAGSDRHGDDENHSSEGI